MSDELDRLIVRLEGASEGSRELDAHVIAYLVGGEAAVSEFNGLWCVYRGTDRHGKRAVWQPRSDEIHLYRCLNDGPTRSIDSAISLVPEGWSRQHRTAEHHENGFQVDVWRSWGPDAYRRTTIRHRSEAVALCIAALCARRTTLAGEE